MVKKQHVPAAVFCGCLFILFALAFRAGAEPAVAGPGRAPQYRPKYFPFDKGESVVYQGSWLGIPVASAEIQMTPVVMNGKKFYQARVLTSTWKYLDLIWKMRDTVESLFDAESMQPYRFSFRQRENKKKIDTTASFDPQTTKWTIHRQDGAKSSSFEFVSPFTLDPISATYLARSIEFKVGDTLRFEIFGGRSRYLVALEVAGREQVAVRNGTADAYRIVPHVWNMTGSGYAERVRDATLWISADENRRPLKMVSQVFIGSVVVELVESKT